MVKKDQPTTFWSSPNLYWMCNCNNMNFQILFLFNSHLCILHYLVAWITFLATLYFKYKTLVCCGTPCKSAEGLCSKNYLTVTVYIKPHTDAENHKTLFRYISTSTKLTTQNILTLQQPPCLHQLRKECFSLNGFSSTLSCQGQHSFAGFLLLCQPPSTLRS